ncbi:unnamed protein product [Somion occarium]|uniref:Uncharacterized protein n=1 Tax=Somion occarium TaxID=3059160 RepID=A0ABP1E1Q2_9APHY
MIDVRNGGPSSGYISSGLSGGITLSCVLLLWVNGKVGERRVIFIYMLSQLHRPARGAHISNCYEPCWLNSATLDPDRRQTSVSKVYNLSSSR